MSGDDILLGSIGVTRQTVRGRGRSGRSVGAGRELYMQKSAAWDSVLAGAVHGEGIRFAQTSPLDKAIAIARPNVRSM